MSVHELALAKQTARGTAATAAAYRIPLTGGTMKPRRVVNLLEETSASRLRSISYVSEVGVEGNPEYAVRPEAFGLLLALALGTQAVSGAADPYTHTFNEATTRPYATAWRMLQNLLREKFVDVKLTQLVLTSTKGSPLKAAMTWQGLDPQALESADYTTEVTVAEEGGDPIMHYDGAGALQVDGSVVSSIENIVITIGNNDTFQQGDNVRGYDIPEGMLDISIATTQLIEDVALYNLFHYGSETPSTGDRATKEVASLANGIDFLWTQVGAVPGPERSLRFQATDLDLQDAQGYEPNTNNDPLKATHTYRLMRPSSGSGVTVTLKNGRATVY